MGGILKPSRIWTVFHGEWLHVLRDRRSLLIGLILPSLILLLTSNSFINTLKPLEMAVVDQDGTTVSRGLLGSVEGTNYFKLQSVPSRKKALSLLEQGRVRGTLLIPQNFSAALQEGKTSQIEILLNVPDPLSAGLSKGYLNSVIEEYPLRFWETKGHLAEQKKAIEQFSFSTLFNPDLDNYNFVIPALIGCILMSILPFLSAVSIVREKETGNFDRILASPASPLEFLSGKTAVYLTIGLFQFVLLCGIGVFGFGIPFRGDLFSLMLLGGVFCVWTVLFGIMISTFTRHQMTALISCVALTLLPAFIFSGLFFAPDSIPMPVRLVTYLVPSQYFTIIARGIFLKGTSLLDWWPAFVTLCLITIVTLSITYLRFRRIAQGP